MACVFFAKWIAEYVFHCWSQIGSVVMSIQVAITQTMTYILTLEAQLPDVMYNFEMNNENACEQVSECATG
jgi:hypothetical protein